jgi:small redox-active disulfide protein 2
MIGKQGVAIPCYFEFPTEHYMTIKILGPGCPKCAGVEENVKKAVLELNIKAEISKIKDLNKIIDMGVMQTPAIVINDKVVSQGKLLTVEQIKELIIKGGK